MKLTQDRRQIDVRTQTFEYAQPDPPSDNAALGPDSLHAIVEHRQGWTGILEKKYSSICQRHSPSGALHQLHTQLLLHFLNRDRKTGLHEIEPPRGRSKTPFLRQGDKASVVPDVH